MTAIEYIQNLKIKIKSSDINILIEILKLLDQNFKTYINNHLKFNDERKDNFADEQEFRKIVFRKLLDKTSTLNQNQITYLWYQDDIDKFEMNKCAEIYQLNIDNIVNSLKEILDLIKTNKLLNKLTLNDAVLITSDELKERIDIKEQQLKNMIDNLKGLLNKLEKF